MLADPQLPIWRRNRVTAGRHRLCCSGCPGRLGRLCQPSAETFTPVKKALHPKR